MHPNHWVEDVFGAKANVRLLRVLFQEPDKYWTEREAADAAGVSTSTAHAALRRLARLGILDDRKVGTSHMLRLHPDSALTADVRAVFERESETLDRVRDAMARAVPDGVACYLFGSTADGDTRASSDLDILVVARDRDRAAAVAADIRYAAIQQFPGRLEFVLLDEEDTRRERFQELLAEVRRHGVRLGRTTLEEFAS